MSLEFQCTLSDDDPTRDRPKSTYWSDQQHAENWARATVSSSPDPEAVVVITRTETVTVAVIQKEQPNARPK